MKPRSPLDSRLLALLTIAFGVVCASAVLIDLQPLPEMRTVSASA